MTAKVLVVDDMALYRSVISGCVRDAQGLDLVGTANDGSEVRSKVEELKPDLITLDMEMPNMTGIDVLKDMQTWPAHVKKPHVIVFSAHSQAGAEITVQALSLGANDFVLKPTSSQGVKAISEGLIPKLLAIAETEERHSSHSALPSISAPTLSGTQLTRLVTRTRKLLVIASSTGGPQALETALSPFPSSFPVPIIIVQHMPPMFTKTMADRFDKSLSISVKEAELGDELKPGHAYIVPGDYHLVVNEYEGILSIELNQEEKVYGLRPAADVTFDSLGKMAGSVLAAVFTGMGQDGLNGLKPLHGMGSAILTQTDESCVVYGMPRAIDEAKLSHQSFTPENFYDVVSKYNLNW